MIERSDIELMQALAGDDPEAFGILIDRYQQPLLNFFLRLGVYHDSEDLVQETFLRLYKSRMRYQPKAKFTTYLYRIAKTVWIDRYRKVQRQSDLREKYGNEKTGPADPNDRHQWMDVQEAVQALPDKLRPVVVMSIFQGFKYAEIAEVLEIPEGTVKSRMSLAMKALKDQLNTE
jgi:RNA polymerase sigma-70 factor (ECF subfamily)